MPSAPKTQLTLNLLTPDTEINMIRSTTSGSLAAGTTTVQAQPAALCYVSLTPAAAVSTVTVYDNKSAGSGTILAQLSAPANASTVEVSFHNPSQGLTGITVVVTGAAATAIVHYVLY